MNSSKRVAEPPQVDLYQAQDTAQPSRQDTVKVRKPKQSKKAQAEREQHQREEIRFNLGYSFRDARTGASARRRQARVREDGDTFDYPPPPTYEVATSPTLSSLASSVLASSTFVAGVHIHPEHSPFANRTSSSGSTQPPATQDNVTINTDAVSSALPATHLSIPAPAPAPALSPSTTSVPVPSPRPSPPSNLAPGSCTFPATVHQKALLDDDESSIEIVDLDPSLRWEMDRQRGLPLEQRVTRHHHLTVESHVPTVPPQRTRLFSQAQERSSTSQSRFANSRLSLRIPEGQDPFSDDRTQVASDISSPATPKHKLPIPSLPLSPSRIFHRSQSPQPSSSVISLLRNPSPFFKSTPSLLNLSSPSALHSSHRDHHLSRKLFHRKQKERASSEPLDDWEVLDRTDSSHSSLEDSPAHPSPPSPTPALSSGFTFTETWPSPDDVFTEDTLISANRHPYCPSVQSAAPTEEHSRRPASPPFVNRLVRRRTSSSIHSDHISPSSAPVSPISSYSASLFSSSSLSLAATVGRTHPSFSQQHLGVCEESERSRLPTRGITLRSSPSLSTLSLSQPPVGKALTSFSQMNLGTHQTQHDHGRSHSTPRAVAPLALPKTIHPQARVSTADVTYIDYKATPISPTSTTAPGNSLPTRSATERVSRRRTPARREEILIHRGRSLSRDLGMRSAPAYSTIFPSGPPTPPPESHTPPYSPAPASPRRHYPGRPLPQTPSTTPALTWLVGRGSAPSTSTISVTSNIIHHPRAIPGNLDVPEGLLIDLDDNSLDQYVPSNPSHTPPLPTRTPPLPNRTPPLPSNTPMIPLRTPLARTPPLPQPSSTPMIPHRIPLARTPPPSLPIDYLEDDIESDNITVGSSSPKGPLTPTSTTLSSAPNFTFAPCTRAFTPPTPE